MLTNSLINDFMVRCDLLIDSILKVLHAGFILFKVDIAETAIEEDFARVQPELQTQLFIVNIGIPAQIKQCVVEIGQGFFEVAEQEVGDALLEICHRQVLVQLNTALIAFHLKRNNISTGNCKSRAGSKSD